MSSNNRLAILSTLLWAAILGFVFFARYPAEDLIAQSVQATMQAKGVIPSTLESPVFSEDLRANISLKATTQIVDVTTVPADKPDPCLFAKLVAETIPDGTEMKAGVVFTKTWVIENTGSCPWTSAYRLVFNGGEQMGAPDSTLIGQAVEPGERVTISINLTAPSFTGSARSNWTLSTDHGVRFGDIWAEIDVVS